MICYMIAIVKFVSKFKRVQLVALMGIVLKDKHVTLLHDSSPKLRHMRGCKGRRRGLDKSL